MGVPESKLVLGKHSGRHALKKRCEDLGFDADAGKNWTRFYQRFTALADNKKGLRNEEIVDAGSRGVAARRSKRRRSRARLTMNLNILVLPGDGIGTEVTREACAFCSTSPRSVSHHADASRRAAGRHRDSQDRHSVSGGNREAGAEADATLMGAVGLPEFDNCAAGEAAGTGPAGHPQGAGRLRQSAAGAHLHGAARFFAAEERIWWKART